MKFSFNLHAAAFMKFGFGLLAGLGLSLTALAAPATAPVSLATSPLANSTTSAIKPNLMFILDDSGSMASNYLPDWANDSICKRNTGTFDASCDKQPPYRSSDFNGIYYNPAISYKPAVNADGSSKPSQTTWTSVKNDAYNLISTGSTNLVTGYADVEWCTDASYTDCLRNDNYILPGTVNGKAYTTSRAAVYSTGSGLVATGSLLAPTTATRSWGPHYYKIIPGEYCDSEKLTNCQTTETAVFQYPAKVRWCNSAANATAITPAAGSCQGVRSGSFTNARYPTKFFQPAVAGSPAVPGSPAVAPTNGTLRITAVARNKSVSIRCGSTYIGQSGTFTSSNSTTASTRLDALYTSINTAVNGYTISCTKGGSPTTSLNCSVAAPAGVSACSGGFNVDSDITTSINTGPSGGSNAVAAQPAVPAIPASYPGSFLRVDIVTGQTYPKVAARTDCTGAVGPSGCSYAEEMTNFANWWTYYQTRMQAMKTAASLAFKNIDNRYRVGYSSINSNTGSDFLNVEEFNSTQKSAWYAKLFAAKTGNSTPLRSSLTRVGRLYAGKLTSFNGVAATDPMQYSCQQNFTILSTDGYWNSDADSDVKDINGSPVGNRDGGSTGRPQYEGPTASSNSLADAAKYYYDTDLRDSGFSNCTGALGFDVCENNVFVSSTDNNLKQHMTTFTMGLGVDGTLLYTSDYKTATTGDYYNLKNNLGSPPVNWSVPAANSETAVDDLWHAAVNGEGIYFSAKNPDDIVSSLTAALNSIISRIGSGAAAATSTLNPVAGDNFAYVASYTTGKWTGNLEARTITVTTGVVSESAAWCVEDVVGGSCPAPGVVTLDTVSGVYNCVTGTVSVEVPTTCTGKMAQQVQDNTRKIWTKGPNASTLNNFKVAGGDLSATDFSAAKLDGTFVWADGLPHNGLSQNTASFDIATAVDKIVDYLRGDKSYEDKPSNPTANRLFRYREATLGDAVESQPAYIGKPTFSYTDTGYSSFKSGNASRAGTVYMGANDGMMHAFDAVTGVERWAYVPSMLVPKMFALADKNYSIEHAYYANGSPIISDIYTGGAWKTILVAGLNGGGRGYYALDITNPAAPSLLWEFTPANDADLGFTYGKPVITKKSDGTWVVLVTSGYNNIPDVSPRVKYPLASTGDGKGYLYVLDASTGTKISKISTGVGSTSVPSGLAQIASWADDPEKNNTATFTYGGDLLGNVWRFNINAGTVMKFAELKDTSGVAQPITTPPELGNVLTSDGKTHRVIFIGTGKYLETADLTDTQQQTLYAIRDDDTLTSTPSPTLVNPRSFTSGPNRMVQQVISAAGASRTATSNTIDFKDDRGWYVNFPDSGERQNVASQLVLGTLLVPTTVPSNTICAPGGTSWLNYFNYKTGGAVDTATNQVSSKANAPIVGINVIYIPDVITGKPKPVVSVVTADHPTPEVVPGAKFSTSGAGFQKKRVIWRELVKP